MEKKKVEVWKRDHAPGSKPACNAKGGMDEDALSAAKKKIDKLVKENKVVLFMKGTKHQPMCGFSAQVVDLLNDLGADFKDVNVLEDEAIRSAVKEYSKWPTIPQLYIKGKFIGGCDISVDLYNSGELEKMLKA